MIYSRLADVYGKVVAEGVLLEAMSFLGRLPNSSFAFRERETCPRVSCVHSHVWFAYLDESDDEFASEGDTTLKPNYSVHLMGQGRFDYVEFESSSMEDIATEVERHERTMRSNQAKTYVDEQVGFDTGVIRRPRRIS